MQSCRTLGGHSSVRNGVHEKLPPGVSPAPRWDLDSAHLWEALGAGNGPISQRAGEALQKSPHPPTLNVAMLFPITEPPRVDLVTTGPGRAGAPSGGLSPPHPPRP